ncbi:hypothetical protein BKE56_017835 [Rhodococcus sp. M8]|nr:hypothetical protein BKE56_017835 [Rhodococcus sp. M8]
MSGDTTSEFIDQRDGTLSRGDVTGEAGNELEIGLQLICEGLQYVRGKQTARSEICCQRHFDVPAVPGISEIRRTDHDPGCVLPQEYDHFGMEKPAVDMTVEDIPPKTRSFRLSVPIGEHGYGRRPQTLFELEPCNKIVDRAGVLVDTLHREKPSEAVSFEEVGFEGESRGNHGDGFTGAGGCLPMVE